MFDPDTDDFDSGVVTVYDQELDEMVIVDLDEEA